MKSNNEEYEVTTIWSEYQKGVMYNRSKGLYTNTEKNYNFYHGKQWENANLGGIQPMIYNIIKPIVKYKLGVIYQNHYEIVFNPNTYATIEEGRQLANLCKALNKHIARTWELQQADKRIRESTKDACINDEGIVHTFYDENSNQTKIEVIDKNNVCYGNENNPNIQEQPYIIITYRMPVSKAKEIAEANGINEETIKLILPDGETTEQAGYNSTTDEVNPMCLILLKYYKKDGVVHYTRGTKYVTLEKDISTEMGLYPIAHYNWEEQKGSARGIGAVNCIIPNQIEINKIEARRCLAVKMGAFPKLVYNSGLIENASSLNKVGTTIEVTGGATVDDVKKAVGYIYPSSMSNDANNLAEQMKSNTRELEGAGDVATGNVDPTQASGKAILAVQQANQQPLSEQVDNFKSFVEDIARIWYEIWKTYYVEGLDILVEEKDAEGNIVEEPAKITYEQLTALEPNIKVDITPRSPYDRYAEEQSLENLYMSDKITFDEYIDALPDTSAMPKNRLEVISQRRKENERKIAEIEAQANELQSAMNIVMNEERRNEENEMSPMQTSGNVSQEYQEQPNNVQMSQVQ